MDLLYTWMDSGNISGASYWYDTSLVWQTWKNCWFNKIKNNISGANNTAVGYYSLVNNTSGSNNTALGYGAEVSSVGLTNATVIGNGAIVNASDKVRIGDANVTVIEGAVAFTPSDKRFKSNINENVSGLDFINRLRPVTYNFDTKKFDAFLMKNMPDSVREKRMKDNDYTYSSNLLHTGFIAQEVEVAAKECGFNFEGVYTPKNQNENYSVAYSQFVVPLVKAVQEQQDSIQKQQKLIDLDKSKISTLEEQVKLLIEKDVVLREQFLQLQKQIEELKKK